MSHDQYSSIPDAITAIANGEFVIVADNEDRENEGDLILASEFATEEKIAFLLRHSSGIVCVPMKSDRLIELELDQMVKTNSDAFGTAFTVTVDAKDGITTGVSAADRAETIRQLSDSATRPSDFHKPGHIFPLRAKPGGTLIRAGHTEASVDLAELAGCQPCAVICEMMNASGEMMRTGDLFEFSRTHNIPFITIDQLIKFRRNKEQLVDRVATNLVETRYGEVKAVQYICPLDASRHMAFVNGEIDPSEPVNVRVHRSRGILDMIGYRSELVADTFDIAMKATLSSPPSILVVLAEEANYEERQNAFPTELEVMRHRKTRKQSEDGTWKEIGIGAQIIRDLGARQLNVVASAQHSYAGLQSFGLEVVSQESLEDFASNRIQNSQSHS